MDTVLDTDLEKTVVVSVLYIDRSGRGGVKGDEFTETLVAALAVRPLGEGVSGMRPPAVLDENRPVWLFIGVDTCVAAIVNVLIWIELTSQCFDRCPVGGSRVNEGLEG